MIFNILKYINIVISLVISVKEYKSKYPLLVLYNQYCYKDKLMANFIPYFFIVIVQLILNHVITVMS